MDGGYYQEALRLLGIARSSYAAAMGGLKEPRSMSEAIAILAYLRDESQGMAARAANLCDLLSYTLQDLQKGGAHGSDANPRP